MDTKYTAELTAILYWVDDFPFIKVGYVRVCVYLYIYIYK